MSERNKLRKTLREHYDAQEVPYNEQDWQAASSLLEGERNKNKRLVAVYVLAAFLGLSFLGLSVYTNFKDNSEKQVLSYAKPVPETNHAHARDQKPIETNTNSYPEKIKIPSANLLKQRTSSKRKDLESATIRKSKVSEAAYVASALVPAKVSLKTKDKNLDKTIMIKNSEIKSLIKEENKQNEPGNVANVVSIQISSKNLSKTKDKTPNKTIAPVNSEIDPQIIDREEKQDQSINAEITSTTKPEVQNSEVAKVEALPKNGAISLSENNAEASLKTESKVTELAGESEEQPDTTTGNSDNPVYYPFVEEGLFYEVGAAWLYGWKNNTGRDARGFSPTAGINYMNRIANRFALSFGVHYMQVRNLSASSKTSKESIYKYGEQSKVTTITPSTLHYLLVPLRLNYFMNERNSFGAGINLAYLLNVEARINTYDEKPGSTENQKSYKQSGYTEGISWYDSQAALFYTRKVNKSFALKTEIFFGLTDIKQNDFFGLNYKERNSGVKITLLYYAFNKKNQQ